MQIRSKCEFHFRTNFYDCLGSDRSWISNSKSQPRFIAISIRFNIAHLYWFSIYCSSVYKIIFPLNRTFWRNFTNSHKTSSSLQFSLLSLSFLQNFARFCHNSLNFAPNRWNWNYYYINSTFFRSLIIPWISFEKGLDLWRIMVKLFNWGLKKDFINSDLIRTKQKQKDIRRSKKRDND